MTDHPTNDGNALDSAMAISASCKAYHREGAGYFTSCPGVTFGACGIDGKAVALFTLSGREPGAAVVMNDIHAILLKETVGHGGLAGVLWCNAGEWRILCGWKLVSALMAGKHAEVGGGTLLNWASFNPVECGVVNEGDEPFPMWLEAMMVDQAVQPSPGPVPRRDKGTRASRN